MYLVTSFTPSSVYLWMDGCCEKKKRKEKKDREYIEEKLLEGNNKGDMIRRMKLLGHFQFSSFSLPLSFHYFYSLLFVSIVFHWRGYMKRDNIRSGEIRDFSHRSFRGYSINNNNNNNNCIIDLHVCSCKKFKTNVRPANSSSVINFLLHALQFRTFFT